ncbi:GNAT family N-acetyltransferase [Nocardioides sp. 503]|uniref:GNAT family N-acetyltransferase n=1 Tax=Nocardioides sp. 503 TaxID=2508326 RepID=UPI00106F888C|nr:GNAT family N-acetyltransferase [Nocardioides sp. 503]
MTDAGIRHLRLERVDPARDSPLLHAWVVEDRAQFWMMTEHTLEEVREIYEWIDEQPTHAAYLAWADDEAAALFQTYDPRAEEVGEHLDVRPGDVGVHFMLAPPTSRRSGFTGTVVAFLLDTVFADPTVQRLVAEPDARNAKAVALVERLGFELGPVVQLSTKPARLAFFSRAAYESMPRER